MRRGKLRVYQSQRVEGLATSLARHLYEKRDPFALPWVVVPNQTVKEWLSHHLAQEWGVAMGIRFLFLEEALRELAQSPHPFPNRFELALKIAKVLEGGDFGPASTYAQKGDKHLISLSNALADPLMHWGVYGEGKIEGPAWQQALVREVYVGWKTPYQLLEGKAPVVTPPALHLFGFTHLPPLYLRFLAQSPFTLYLFTPCAQFWTDTVSEKTALRLDIPQETNPLLADWGRLNRRLLKEIEEGEAEVFEDYPLPKEVAEHGAYADYLGGELSFREGELTRLTSLQADLLLMKREPLGLDDESLRIYGAQSRLAEVELCSQEVLEKGIDPAGLLVMAPDITLYVPYIEAVFERHNIPYRILDIQQPASGSLEAGLLQLLELHASRWEASRLLKLFNHPLFAAHVNLSSDALGHIETWVSEGEIRWGRDRAHWEELLGQAGGEVSWEAGFARLFHALSCLEEEGGLSVEISQAETLGQFCSLWKALCEAMAILETGLLTLEEWGGFWDTLSLKFFGKASPLSLPILKDISFSFAHLKPHLERFWGVRPSSRNANQLEGITFSPFLPMRARPTPHLFLMGMDEEAFPRKRFPAPIDLFHKDNPIPTPAELDRSLFLEAVHSARRSLTLSYTNISPEDGLPQNPSPLVDDLLTYLGETPLTPSSYKRGRAPPKLSPPLPIPQPSGEMVVDIRDLKLSASDPLRLYFRHLGVNPEKREGVIEDSEPFHPDSLEATMAAWSAAGHPSDFERPNLPGGPFGPLFANRIALKGKELRREIEKITAGPLEVLDLGQVEPLVVQLEGDLRVRLVGQVGPLAQEGLVSFSKGATPYQHLPQLLVFAALVEERNLPYVPKLHLKGKSFGPPPRGALKRYLRYHLRCLREPSPLHGELIAELMGGKTRLTTSPHASWVWGDTQAYEEAVERWRAEVHEVFGVLI